jgi:hypothetical protein
MTTVLDVQRALLARGYDLAPYGVDGDIGPTTLGAMLKALEKLPIVVAEAPKLSTSALSVPADWMPWAKMQRIIVHWTGGASTASGLDLEHYHVLLEGSGKLVRGKRTIKDNETSADGVYAAHTKGCNTGSIGVALCGMAGAREHPFDRGSHPITREQWDVLPSVLADLCRRYAINPARTTVLSHAEVQGTLGIKQNGKWDIARLPFDITAVGAMAIGDRFRAATRALL